jgi:double zinc ribbon protein
VDASVSLKSPRLLRWTISKFVPTKCSDAGMRGIGDTRSDVHDSCDLELSPMGRCSACSAESPAEARFCMACGAPLERRCESCGEPVLEGARFCMTCGVPLNAASAASEPAAKQSNVVDPDAPRVALALPTFDERRMVTVLFADLSGYTAVAARLDPEAVKRQLERILGRLGDEVLAYGGYVDKVGMSTSSSATT